MSTMSSTEVKARRRRGEESAWRTTVRGLRLSPELRTGLLGTAVLALLAELREPVDAFFDQVMVMAEDPAVRDNRLALLTFLRDLFLNVADISLLQE